MSTTIVGISDINSAKNSISFDAVQALLHYYEELVYAFISSARMTKGITGASPRR